MEFTDDYEHLDSTIEYVLENILFEPSTLEISETNEYKQLKELFYSAVYSFCKCTNLNCKTNCCSHGINYKAHENELLLNEKRPGHDLIYECTIMCKCSNNETSCGNRLVQFGPRKHLQIIVSQNLHTMKGLGLTTSQTIPKGAFVCEYAGEIITKQEAERRHKLSRQHLRANHEQQLNQKDAGNNRRATIRNENQFLMNYIICLNEYSLDDAEHASFQMFIDPSAKGNIGRYLNHSCNPNCEIISIRYDGLLPKLGIFTKRIVQPFEELCFHYGGEQRRTNIESQSTDESQLTECLCGEAACEKYLPNLKF